MKDLTIVTGLFDLGRANLVDGFRRDFSHYIECFEKFLRATKDFPLIVYIEAENEHIVWKHRQREDTFVVIKTLEYLREFPFYAQVQDIRQKPEWRGQSGWIPDSPQSALELYNPLVMSKQFMLNDATLFGRFDTKYYLWLDAGLSNTVDLERYLNADFERRIVPHMNKMLYLCFPYDGEVEVHGFTKGPMNRYAGAKTTYVARGGVFGGSKEVINQVNDAYYGILRDTINAGYMGTEESIFTILTYKHKNLCNIRMIESNDLVYKFFEDIKSAPLKPVGHSDLAIYVLVYNLPQQFRLWIDSFKTAYPRDFDRLKKYVINNSNDPTVDEEYKKLFAEHGFEEFKFDNIGINSGRFFCAEHFDKSDHEYMIFFEDDMLLHTDPARRCKNGFATHQTDLFEKLKYIMKEENLDYLKLTFSEFFGDNHDNWAWDNIGPEHRPKYFRERTDDVSNRKVKIDYTGCHRGLSYAVGEYHYCNWPLIFTKEGSRKVFLRQHFDHKYEQRVMSYVMTDLHHKKMIKAGCLLASPINHNRVYHYKPGTRRENEHYKN